MPAGTNERRGSLAGCNPLSLLQLTKTDSHTVPTYIGLRSPLGDQILASSDWSMTLDTGPSLAGADSLLSPRRGLPLGDQLRRTMGWRRYCKSEIRNIDSGVLRSKRLLYENKTLLFLLWSLSPSLIQLSPCSVQVFKLRIVASLR